ncbi:MAG: hypothetical protein ACK41D_12160 [Rubricoccaceae bacterium]
MPRPVPSCLLLALLLFAACAREPAPPASRDARADALLAAVHADALAPAFERLHAKPFEAVVRTEVLGNDGRALGAEVQRVRFAPGTGYALESRQAEGALEGTTPAAAPPRLEDPLPRLLPDDPPFVAASLREQYATEMRADTLVQGRALARAEARFVPARGRKQPVQRVEAGVDEGRLVLVDVRRAMRSFLLQEDSRVRVELATTAGGDVPRRVVAETAVNVPLAPPRRQRVTWTVTEAGGVPLGAAPRLRSGAPALEAPAPLRPPRP